MKRWLFVLLLAVAPVLAQKAGEGNSAPPTTITGRVLNEDGKPLGGVSVAVFKVGSNSAVRAVTNAEGRFRVTDLLPGSYRLSASLSPYVFASTINTGPNFVGDDVTLTLRKGGVITGQVFDVAGAPIVGAMVAAQRVRDDEGEPASGGSSGSAMTDDRGMYRLFGLPAGAYLVVARNNAGLMPSVPSDAPVYFPSAAREAASEVVVGAGTEASGIDIRWRSESGHRVSGTVSGLIDPYGDASISVSLQLRNSVTSVGSGIIYPRSLDNGFTIYGVPDGDYELSATRASFNANEPRVFSARQPVRVRGGDVTGLEIKLVPPAMMSGKVVVEKLVPDSRSCVVNRVGRVEEITLALKPFETVSRRSVLGWQIAPEANGDFFLRNLAAGHFRLTTALPSDLWYLKSILLSAPRTNAPTARGQSAAPRVVDIAQHGVTLANGEQLAGLTFTIAEGAASVAGRVVTEPGMPLPPHLQVHLVPAEVGASELRFAVTPVRSDATFSLPNLAPGRYWMVARLMPPSGYAPESPADLRRAAVAANQAIDLTACQREKDLVLKFGVAVK